MVHTEFHHDIAWTGSASHWYALDDLTNRHVGTGISSTGPFIKTTFGTMEPPRVATQVLYDNALGRAYNILLQPLTTGGWLPVRLLEGLPP